MPAGAFIGTSELSNTDIRAAVAQKYGAVAVSPTDTFPFPVGREFAIAVGYSSDLLNALPSAASSSFSGVTNIHEWTGLKPGEIVLDLGCGAGLDSLIAAQAVGPGGYVIGVEIAAEMSQLAATVAGARSLHNTHAVRAEVERTPLKDGVADVAIANGVFNLSPEKSKIASEVFRVLIPGGRLVGAEIVIEAKTPTVKQNTLEEWFQ